MKLSVCRFWRARWLGLTNALLWLGLGLLLSGAAAPSRPSSVRLAGVDYVSAENFGARFGLKNVGDASGRKFTLKSTWSRLELEVDSRECRVNGLRIFLGNAPRISRGKLLIAKLDAEKLLIPLLLPGDGQKDVPDLRTIVIDPGHGGRDPGKENRRLQVNEKTLALDTAKRLQRELEGLGYRVLLTRTDDRHLGADKVADLLQRNLITKQAGGDLFISLHFNAVGSDAQRVSGVEVYALTPQYQYSTADSEREDDQGAKEFNLGNRFDHWNTLLGYQVHRQMIDELAASDRGYKRARWAVLRHAECPAILIEAGFLSNDTETRKIMTPAYRQKIAEAIAQGVQKYGTVLAGLRKQRRGQ